MHTQLRLLSVIMLFFALLVSGCSTMTTADTGSDVELRPAMEVSAGDEVYACNCGPKCPCNTLSKNPGKCSCGVDLVKAEVKGVKDGTVKLMINGQERDFKAKGNYACACGLKCPCNTVGQNPGKCTCGVDMAKVKS